MTKNKKRLGAASLTTGLALVLAGGIAPIAASAERTTDAPVSGTAFDTKAQELLQDSNIEGVGVDGNGNVVLLTTASKNNLTGDAASFVSTHDNVQIQTLKAPLESRAATDVVGGAGYAIPTDDDRASLCSIGFTAWSPTGSPAFISAGHCTADGSLTAPVLTDPARDAAGETPAARESLGTLAFSQFGGVGNTPGADEDPNSTDISVFDITNPSLTPRAFASDWKNTSDLYASGTQIRSVGPAKINETVERSGRTTGHTSGQVILENLWFSLGETPDDPAPRFVKGFVSTAHSAKGDSGGAFWQGSTAVGVLSGGGELEDGREVSLATNLVDGLEIANRTLKGYTVALYVDAPAVTSVASGGTVAAGSRISGTAEPGTSIEISAKGAVTNTVTTDASGTWSFNAPTTYERFTFTATAIKGEFNRSTPTEHTVVVAPAGPQFTSPQSDVATQVTEIAGTGIAGATLTLSGDVNATTTVKADGTWNVATDLGYGSYQLEAEQSVNDVTSARTSYGFSIVLAAPTIVSPKAGTSYTEGQPIGEVTGEGIEGATVTVYADMKAQPRSASVSTRSLTATTQSSATVEPLTTVVKNGKWSVALPALAPETYTITATQSNSDAPRSLPASVEVVVNKAASGGNGGGNAGGGDGSGASTPGHDGSLAITGAADITPLGVGALLLLVLGAGLLVLRRSAGVKA